MNDIFHSGDILISLQPLVPDNDVVLKEDIESLGCDFFGAGNNRDIIDLFRNSSRLLVDAHDPLRTARSGS